MEKDPLGKSFKDAASYSGLGIQLALTVVLMLFAGQWLDNKFDTEPLWTIILTLFGSFAGLYNFIKIVLALEKKRKNEKSR